MVSEAGHLKYSMLGQDTGLYDSHSHTSHVRAWDGKNGAPLNCYSVTYMPVQLFDFAVVASDQAVEASAKATAHQRPHSPLSGHWRNGGRRGVISGWCSQPGHST